MSNIEDVKHIINFLRNNEIETGHKKGVEPLENMLKENEELKEQLLNAVEIENKKVNKYWQDKIKDKIKFLDKNIELQWVSTNYNEIEVEKYQYAIEVLEDLLKENNNE